MKKQVKEDKPRNKGGRPSVWKDEYLEQARKLCLLGATDKMIADFFNIDEATLNRWKKSKPGLCESLKSGKDTADMHVAQSLYERALGIKATVKKAIKLKTVEYSAGKRVLETEHVEVVDEEVYYPPDTTACIFWLKNRQPRNWRDKVEQEHSGNVGLSIAWAGDDDEA